MGLFSKKNKKEVGSCLVPSLATPSLKLVTGRIRIRPHIIPFLSRRLTMTLPGTTSLAILLNKVLPLVLTILVIHTIVDLQGT